MVNSLPNEPQKPTYSLFIMTPSASVIIVGAGPTGLMLAIELGRRGVATLLLTDNLETSRTPKSTVSQARTMEHYRRLGIADKVRGTGIPGEHTMDIVYCSRITWHEITRYHLPSPNQSRQLVREDPSTWHTPELTHRSCQMWVEPILLEECRRLPSVTILQGWRLERFDELRDSVTAYAENVSDGRKQAFRGVYLIGCDGAASAVRGQLAIHHGESSKIKEYKGRPMFSVHARAPKLLDTLPFKGGWNYTAFNSVQRGACISLNGEEFKFSFWRPADWTDNEASPDRIARIHYRMFGKKCDFDVISYKFWRGGASLVANSYGRGRVFIAGDAAHLFTPSAGLGYNTGIDDAVNLGWKLAAAVQGWGGPLLLESYERECRPEALRRTRHAAECAERLAVFKPSPELDQNTPEGARARELAARHFNERFPFQFHIPGLNFGARFDDSPLTYADSSNAPPVRPDVYVPSGKPGGRAPHVWLDDGRALFDTFGSDFTLLKLGPHGADGADGADVGGIRQTAMKMRIPLTVVEQTDPEIRDLYGADLVLVRPDQMIAWRGSSGDNHDFADVFSKITGWAK